MSGTQQTEALRLAEYLDGLFDADGEPKQAAAELRRQQARIAELEDATDIAIERIAELEAQLSAIGAGGVEPLRRSECLHQIAEPGCTRSHPHEAMSPECRIRAVIAEMRNREARGAEATEHCLGRFADVLERALADRAMQAQAAPEPQGWKLVPVELLKRIQESLGSFVSDQGWSQSDMDTADVLGGLLATAPPAPAPAPVQLPEPFTTLVRKKSWSTNCYEAAPLHNHRDYGREWADERFSVYTEQQVRELLALIQ